MVKGKLTEKEIVEFLEKKGFKEVTEEEKKTDWYKFASQKPSCFKSKYKHTSKTAKA